MALNNEDNKQALILLKKFGRASTPSVANNKRRLSLRRILSASELPMPSQNVSVAITSTKIHSDLAKIVTIKVAIPGDSYHLISEDFNGMVIVDREAFYEGPWLGGDSYLGMALNEEVYKLCELARTNGIPIYYVETPRPETVLNTRLRNAADCSFPFVGEDELEEGAPLTEVFSVLDRLARKRFA